MPAPTGLSKEEYAPLAHPKNPVVVTLPGFLCSPTAMIWSPVMESIPSASIETDPFGMGDHIGLCHLFFFLEDVQRVAKFFANGLFHLFLDDLIGHLFDNLCRQLADDLLANFFGGAFEVLEFD